MSIKPVMKFLYFLCYLLLWSCESDIQVNLNEKISLEQRVPVVSETQFFIENSSSGDGVILEENTLKVSESLTLYSVERDSSEEFIRNHPVSWSVSGVGGDLIILEGGKSARFEASGAGVSKVSIIQDGEVLSTVTINVIENDLVISNLVVSEVTNEGFRATIDVTGGTSSATHTLYYCNKTNDSNCDPLLGSSILLGGSGDTRTVSISGLSNPTDEFAFSIVSEDLVDVIGSPINDTQVLAGTPIMISNLQVSNASLSGMDISIDFSGDNENSATVTLYYCNETDSAGCDPLAGSSLSMTRGASSYTASLSGLSSPYDEADELNLAVVAVDPDGVTGSPLSTSEYLADLRLNNLSVNSIVSSSFYVSAAFVENNSNASATVYYCSETDVPGCDPLSGASAPLVRNGTNFEATVSGLSSPFDHGDILNIQVVGSDVDGEVHLSSMTESFRLTDMEFSDLALYSISQQGFFVDTRIADDNVDTNSNLDIKGYWCNNTVSPGCDPTVTSSEYTNVGGWRAYGFEIDDLVASPGDEISVTVVINDVDGIYLTSTGVASTSGVLTTSLVVPDPTPIYRSVGPGQTLALSSGTISGGTLSISSDQATFSLAQALEIGVGDVIFYDPSGGTTYTEIAFIHARASSTSYTVKNVNGENPTNTSGAVGAWKIYRAYTSGENALIGSENPGISSDSDISSLANFDTWVDGKDISAQTGSDEIWNFAFYAGVQADNQRININDDWVKDKSNTIKLFTPYLASHVGVSQRHNGVWDDTKYHLSVEDQTAIRSETNTTTIEGFQIEAVGTAGSYSVIYSRNNQEGFISHNIIKNSSTGENLTGIQYYDYSQRGVNYATIYNNLIYDFSTTGSYGFRVQWQSDRSNSVKFYNNTLYNNYVGLYSRSYRSTQMINNIIMDSVIIDVDGDGSGGFYNALNNIFSDTSIDSQPTTAGKSGNQTNVSSSGLFVDLAGRNFAIIGTEAIDTGFDNSAEYLDDITSNARDANFDIGAFEN